MVTKEEAIEFAYRHGLELSRFLSSRRVKFKITFRYDRQERNGLHTFVLVENKHEKGRVFVGLRNGRVGIVDQYHFMSATHRRRGKSVQLHSTHRVGDRAKRIRLALARIHSQE